ncbi:MAG: 50S ribosomal protein L35ae [Nitrososphaerota archaeon]|nr:50S ribosomal protein L35ae [Candidatus Bathyarchaeota archaeon]MCX8162266.1 50S ribosomal protein L35ae [Candidatus Bathyarchaeota archaeon]MDW8062082.1 50S ribosomal protein L35ae [Nitrososphaerota archaeon]
MKARILQYGIGPKKQYSNKLLVKPEGVESYSEASRLIGRKLIIEVKLGGKMRKFHGKIVAVHGRNGVVIARMNRGVPGTILGSTAEIL